MKTALSQLLKSISNSKPKLTETKYTTDEVAKYYENYTDSYLQATGDFIQAYRTDDTDSLMEYLVNSMGLHEGMNLLDAGCGVGAPAIWIAKHVPNTTITCVTNSKKQSEIAAGRVKSAGLEDRVKIIQGDYHQLESILPASKFDVIYFFESLGHNHDLDAVFKGANSVLKTGGTLYVKDFFRRFSNEVVKQQKIDEVIEIINRNYLYNVMNLPDLIKSITSNNLSLNYIRSLNTPSDIGITAAFENKTGRLTYPSFSKIRAVDWYEISVTRD